MVITVFALPSSKKNNKKNTHTHTHTHTIEVVYKDIYKDRFSEAIQYFCFTKKLIFPTNHIHASAS